MSVACSFAEDTIALCRSAAERNRATPARRGNVINLTADCGNEILIAADLHGQRLNFERLCRVADLANHPGRHLVMQEVCHGGPEYPGGGCMSHLLLEDIARLKLQFPDRFHFLLSNHELAELTDYPISKARRVLNLSFRAGIQELYGSAAEDVRRSYQWFIGTCPLAVRLPHGVFISHSLPERVDCAGFAADILDRPLEAADWQPGGPVFKFVWGRDYRAANAEAFAKLVGAELLIHGHEPCPDGCRMPNPRQVIIDCCSGKGAYLQLPIGPKLTHADVVAAVRRIFPVGCCSNKKGS